MSRPYLWNPTSELSIIRQDILQSLLDESDPYYTLEKVAEKLKIFNEYLVEMLGEM